MKIELPPLVMVMDKKTDKLLLNFIHPFFILVANQMLNKLPMEYRKDQYWDHFSLLYTLMKNIWRKYMEKLLNVENDWDGQVDCPEVMGPHGLISEEVVASAIKGLKIGKSAGPTGVVSEMMKAAGGFGSRWMTDLINNIVKEGCIPDDWRKSILVPVYKGKGDPLV